MSEREQQRPAVAADPPTNEAHAALAQGPGNAAMQELMRELATGPAGTLGETIAVGADFLRSLLGGEGSAEGVRPPAPEPSLPKDDAFSFQAFQGVPFVQGAGDSHAVHPSDVRQGALGDCYFVAAMRAVAARRPDLIQKLIKDNGDGTYDVTLYRSGSSWSWSAGPTVVKGVSNAFPVKSPDAPAYAKVGDTGPQGPELWVMLLEKAWAIHKGGYGAIEGGWPGAAMEVLTGGRASNLSLASQADTALLTRIQAALSANQPMTTYTPDFAKQPEDVRKGAEALGVIGNHAYAVVGVNVQAGTVDLDNPWGSRHQHGLKVADYKKFYSALQILAT